MVWWATLKTPEEWGRGDGMEVWAPSWPHMVPGGRPWAAWWVVVRLVAHTTSPSASPPDLYTPTFGHTVGGSGFCEGEEGLT